MIFSITDYFKYRAQKGAYSIENITSQGGLLAVAKNFTGVSSINPMELFFCHTQDSFISWMIMYHTESVWSHTGMFSENGCILDATTGGLIEHPLSDYFDGKGYISVRTFRDEISDEQRQQGLMHARSQLGCGFNWFGVVLLFLDVISGSHAHYRIRYTIDILISLAMLALAFIWIPMSGLFFGALASIYLLIVLLNTPRRKKMRSNTNMEPNQNIEPVATTPAD